ncbi:GNAT family N-acetyltransferase [Luteimicrobium subarcticum]|uniref:Acetyltransferase (GNAT) family protein n=1 Tax=Luteimicrobium subarcticum TaxID=620910 RepID=A0A2M8W6J7_9MICO|nr:GNAT family N-acetyltransferase [Luteimicrobium subarcticum]PJI86555.1 acetyltransferase (GNAT) family protein [Luteimicrobium subarcticum]
MPGPAGGPTTTIPTLPIRRADVDDRAEVDRVYEICLRTGASGADATDDYDDPRLIGEVYAGQYLRFAPDLAFVLEHPEDGVVGYVLGAADTRSFEDVLEAEWWPALRARYPEGVYPEDSPSAARVRTIHHPDVTDDALLADYPAHLHVDLLPAAQGGGNGRRILATLLDALRQQGVRGVHLGVAPDNVAAQGFYEHVGFVRLNRPGVVFGMRLDG